MKKIILLFGDLATGKSTLSNVLANRYHCLLINKDNIKEILADCIGFESRQENLKLSHATYELIKFMLLKIAPFGYDLILESNFHKDELNELYMLLDNLEYEYLSIVLTGDIDILYHRFVNRAFHQNRHPAHLSAKLDIYENFKDYILKNRNWDLKGKIMHLNANDFSYQCEKTFSEIDEFFK